MRFIAVFLLAIVVLAACTPSQFGEMRRKYAEAALEADINAIYPPRESFQVGDVFLVATEPDDRFGSVSLWIGSIPELLPKADEFLKTRLAWQRTGEVEDSTKPADNKTSINQEDFLDSRLTTRSDEYVRSLPISAVPSFTTYAGLTTSTGLTSAMAAIGFGTSDQTTVTLDFNDVRSYEVPKVWAADYLGPMYLLADQKKAFAIDTLDQMVAAQEESRGKKWKKGCLKVALVTKVHLTRHIQYTYRDRKIMAAGLKMTTEEGKKASQVANAPTINLQVTTTGVAATDEANTLALAEALRTSVSTFSTAGSAEGGSFNMVSWSLRGITFEQTYQRPVAIGWEGFEKVLTDEQGKPTCLRTK